MNAKFMRLVAMLWMGLFFDIHHANALDGPGMTVTYSGTMKDVSIYIKKAHLPSGKEFPTAVSFGYAENPLAGGATMGAAPDGRQLPEWIDFEWMEPPYPGLERAPSDPEAYKEWGKLVDEQFRTLPVKKQRVLIRNRIPKAVIDEVIDANAHAIARYGPEKRLAIHFIWTTQGIKLRWNIWHTPKFNPQYDSHEGGDEVIPEGTTMVAIYADTIKEANSVVSIDNYVKRNPPVGRSSFSGLPAFAYTDRPLDGGGLVVRYEHEPQLPESVDFDWRLFPLSTPGGAGESDAEYESRVHALYNALPKKIERVAVRSRIPQAVQDELSAAARKLTTNEISNSVIFLYFIWTDSGIKLHWRLKHRLPDGSFISVREGGDELTQAAER